MATEFELKYRATQAQLDAIGEAFPQPSLEYAMETVYYDTPDRQLSQKRLTLRLRLENGIPVCTLKTPGDGAARGEFECSAPSIEVAIPILCKLSGEAIPTPVEQVCGARFTRTARILTLPDCTLELALDRGVLLGGGQEEPLFEVEAELKAGSTQALTAFARELAEHFSLVPEKKSKFARAMALEQGE